MTKRVEVLQTVLQGMGEGKRNLQPREDKTRMVGHRGGHDRCPPICEGPQCAEGLTYSWQASEEKVG